MVILLAAECVRDCSWMDQYRALLGDTPHWVFEFTVEVATAVVISLPFRYFWRRWIERHDEQHHAGHTTEEVHL